jgi:hypothetical protein
MVRWPAPGSSERYTTPASAARAFATSFLGFTNPQLGAFEAGDSRSGEVPVRPTANGPVTTIAVRQVDAGDDGWSVLGATTENIDVTAPAAFSTITSPVQLTGRALAFEGTVQVRIRADGNPGPIGEGFVTGGGNVMGPFSGSIPFYTPGAHYGAIVLFTDSAENGQVWQASAFRIAFRSTDADAADCAGFVAPRGRPGPGEMEVKAYFSCDKADAADAQGELRAVYRVVPASPRVLQASLEAMLAGPSPAEARASLGSGFSPATARLLRSVTLSNGHAVVDFADLRSVIPTASSSAGSARLLAQLDATVFQFPTVASVEYRIDGSCEAFNEWLQFGGCEPRTRGAATD